MDPNDPRNLSLLEYQRRLRDTAARGRVFRPSHLPQELALPVPGVLPNGALSGTSGRLQILKMRQSSEVFRKDSVPLRDADIPDYLYAALQDVQRAEQDEAFRLEYQAKQVLLKARRVHSVTEVVNELPQPDLNVDWTECLKCLEPNRRLRPMRVTREPNANPSSCRLVIQVVRAANLPARRNTHSKRSRKKQQQPKEDATTHECFPVVEVKFQGVTQVSAVGHGVNPQWNQNLVFDFQPPNGQFVPSALQQCKEEVYFNVFDRVTSDLSSNSNGAATTKTSLTERRWLGGFSLPFSTIYFNASSVEGFFRMNVPALNLAYEAPIPEAGSFLWAFATLDPPLVDPPQSDMFIPDEPFLRYCHHWVQTIAAEPPCQDRFIVALAEDEHQVAQVITQYVHPLTPPPDFTEGQFLRFVSRIPFLEDMHASESRDVWCSATSFLAMGFGDWEEHAILLANYFLYQEVHTPNTGGSHLDTYVVLGSAVPEGHAVYVLRREISLGRLRAVWLYDAVSGRRYEHDDPHCPLKQIGCAFNATNIWANIQSFDLANLSFDFNNPKFWSPMLPKDLQPTALDLSTPTAGAAADLRRAAARQSKLNAQLASAAASSGGGGSSTAKPKGGALLGPDEDAPGESLLAEEGMDAPGWWELAWRSCLPGGGLTRDYVHDKMLTINGAPLLVRALVTMVRFCCRKCVVVPCG